jgi:hippurate hydrolase
MIRPAIDPWELRRRVGSLLPRMSELRHELHRIPEPKLEERETAARIRELLRPTSLEILPPYLDTDTVALLYGRGGERNVTLRADIDALPLVERSGRPWASARQGYAHACGHDGHMAILLGTAMVLEGLRDRFAGSVRFVFQPAEEEAGGGKMLVERGLLEAPPRPAAVFALHGWPGMPVGRVSALAGAAMAGQDRFRITVKGKGGHAAMPHKAVDPVLTAAQLVTSLQSVVSRSMDPLEPAVVSVCTIHGGTASNVIPDQVEMEGTTRAFSRSVLDELRRCLEEQLRGVTAAAGAQYVFDYREGYVPLVNDPGKVELAREVAGAYLGPQAWQGELPRSMGAEDFAFYLERVPGAFLRLGLGEDSPPLHSPEFDFNDQSLETGMVIMVALALETLAGRGE